MDHLCEVASKSVRCFQDIMFTSLVTDEQKRYNNKNINNAIIDDLNVKKNSKNKIVVPRNNES